MRSCVLVKTSVFTFDAGNDTVPELKEQLRASLFDRRRGCRSGSRGNRPSLQQYQFWLKDKQSYAEAEVVSSSVKAECW